MIPWSIAQNATLIFHMEKFNLRLNPKKCTFGVTSGRLISYIVSTKGIKVNLEKVQVIMDMPPPYNISQMRGLQGRLQSICRFIS